MALSADTQAVYDQFVQENIEKKEVDMADVLLLLGRGAAMLRGVKMANGNKPTREESQQLLTKLYQTLVTKEENGYEEIPRLNELISIVYKIRSGDFEVELGKKGWGCFPCLSSFRVSVTK